MPGWKVVSSKMQLPNGTLNGTGFGLLKSQIAFVGMDDLLGKVMRTLAMLSFGSLIVTVGGPAFSWVKLTSQGPFRVRRFSMKL